MARAAGAARRTLICVALCTCCCSVSSLGNAWRNASLATAFLSGGECPHCPGLVIVIGDSTDDFARLPLLNTQPGAMCYDVDSVRDQLCVGCGLAHVRICEFHPAGRVLVYVRTFGVFPEPYFANGYIFFPTPPKLGPDGLPTHVISTEWRLFVARVHLKAILEAAVARKRSGCDNQGVVVLFSSMVWDLSKLHEHNGERGKQASEHWAHSISRPFAERPPDFCSSEVLQAQWLHRFNRTLLFARQLFDDGLEATWVLRSSPRSTHDFMVDACRKPMNRALAHLAASEHLQFVDLDRLFVARNAVPTDGLHYAENDNLAYLSELLATSTESIGRSSKPSRCASKHRVKEKAIDKASKGLLPSLSVQLRLPGRSGSCSLRIHADTSLTTAKAELMALGACIRRERKWRQLVAEQHCWHTEKCRLSRPAFDSGCDKSWSEGVNGSSVEAQCVHAGSWACGKNSSCSLDDRGLPGSTSVLEMGPLVKFMALTPARVGYCGITDVRSCSKGGTSGAYVIPHAMSETWEQAHAFCMALCSMCPRCRFISLSLQLRDCSWFETCNLSNLKTNAPGFLSIARRTAVDAPLNHMRHVSHAEHHKG